MEDIRPYLDQICMWWGYITGSATLIFSTGFRFLNAAREAAKETPGTEDDEAVARWTRYWMIAWKFVRAFSTYKGSAEEPQLPDYPQAPPPAGTATITA